VNLTQPSTRAGPRPAAPPPDPPAAIRALAEAAGVRINGSAPWDFRVHDERTYHLILTRGSLGFGEAYMDCLWDCDQLDQLFHRLLGVDADVLVGRWARLRLLGTVLRRAPALLRANREAREDATPAGGRHYEIGNDVFEAMLDPTMSYSCGYWAKAGNLEQAQHDKLDLVCRKLELAPGERLLDIGCGWGGLARHAAQYHGVEVLGITLSKEQLHVARERCAGLPVRIELKDYRQIEGRFDKIASVGMFEHVGLANYPAFFDAARRVLADDGLFLLHTIGTHVATRRTDPWIDRYIFPEGKLPAASELAAALEGRFLIEDWHSFGQDYDRTLMAWWARFERAWPSLGARYDERFHRMFRYYLLSSAGFFRSRQGQLWQLVLAKRQASRPYRSVR
jgi:cyclopropane-fatty-acyl-phospholipid synthase